MAGLVCLSLVAAACVGPLERARGGGPEATIGSRPLDRTAAGQDLTIPTIDGPEIDATFDGGPCPFEPIPGHRPRCGTVVVPAEWEAGTGRVELAVAVFPSTAADPAADPVVYLDGGPGSHALDTIQFVTDDFLDPLLERGDVVFFDQRGAGRSTPRLECTETAELTRQAEDQPFLDDDEATGLFRDALSRCRQRFLDDGVPLASFNTINNAHDVEAIRIALGYERWNLFGISYGTKLGLEVLRRHPVAVRTAVLDSVYPPQVDSVLENPASFLDSYRRVVDACNAEPACGGDGDLAERIRAVVARYEAEPVEVEIEDWVSGERDRVFVTGETVTDLVVGALYSPYQFTDVPELIGELERGQTDAVVAFLSQDRTGERFFTDGMFYAIACHEEISFADPAEVTAALPPDPFGLGDRFDLASNVGGRAFGTCEAFENGQAPELSNRAVVSDVPVLLLAGAYDPVTPVSWAEAAAETLPASWLVVGPRASHGVSGDRCGMSVALAFLDHPDRRPDAACLDEQRLDFIGGPVTPVELEPATFPVGESEIEIATVRPIDWSVGFLGGDQYRRASFLDPTELYQLAGDVSLGEVVADFVEEERAVELGPPRPLSGQLGPFATDQLARPWTHRSGRAGQVAVEWFQTGAEVAGLTTYVVLVAPVAELDQLLASVVVPALEAIEVTLR